MVSNARKEKFARQVAISKMEPAVTTHYKGDVVPPPVFAELQELKDANADLNERNRHLHAQVEGESFRASMNYARAERLLKQSNELSARVELLNRELKGERNRHGATSESLFRVKAAFVGWVLASIVLLVVVHFAQPAQTIAKFL